MLGLQLQTDRKDQYPCSFSLGMNLCISGEIVQKEATLLPFSVNEDVRVG